MSNRIHYFALLLGLCCCALGDPGYPPVIENRTGASLHFVLQWADGAPDQPGFLPVGQSAHQRLKGRRLTGIRIRTHGGDVKFYDEDFLGKLRRRMGVRYEVWIVRSSGLTLSGRQGHAGQE